MDLQYLKEVCYPQAYTVWFFSTGGMIQQNKPEHELTAYNIFFVFFFVKPHNTATNNRLF